MTIETSTTQELANARTSFELAENDGQRINDSSSQVVVIVLSSHEMTKFLPVHDVDGQGKEKNLDGVAHKMFMDGVVARTRSIEYSKKTKANAELAKLVAECRNPEELTALLTKLRSQA